MKPPRTALSGRAALRRRGRLRHHRVDAVEADHRRRPARSTWSKSLRVTPVPRAAGLPDASRLRRDLAQDDVHRAQNVPGSSDRRGRGPNLTDRSRARCAGRNPSPSRGPARLHGCMGSRSRWHGLRASSAVDRIASAAATRGAGSGAKLAQVSPRGLVPLCRRQWRYGLTCGRGRLVSRCMARSILARPIRAVLDARQPGGSDHRSRQAPGANTHVSQSVAWRRSSPTWRRCTMAAPPRRRLRDEFSIRLAHGPEGGDRVSATPASLAIATAATIVRRLGQVGWEKMVTDAGDGRAMSRPTPPLIVDYLEKHYRGKAAAATRGRLTRPAPQ